MKKIVLFTFLGFVTTLSAQLRSYSYYRELKPVSADGFYEIKIGSSVLDREGYYRIYEVNEKDTLEVPYIANSSNWEIYDLSFFKSLKVIDKSYEKGKFSYATLVLDTNMIYNCVYLNFNSKDFFKDITLEGSNDNKKWKTILENEKLFHYYREYDDYYRNKIFFEPISFKYLRIKADDSNSERLELLSASVPLIKEEASSDGELVKAEMKRIEEKDKKRTIIECTFPRKYSIIGVELNIENEDPYRRSAEIEFFANPTAKDKYITFGEGTVASDNKSNRIYLNQYSSNDSEFRSNKMRIIINNLDNRPLTKIEIKAFTHDESVKVKLKKDKRYVLAYSKTNDTAPQYDLAYFMHTIPLGLKEVEMGIETKIPQQEVVKQQPLFDNKKWIWVTLVGCVLLIGVFAVRLLKK